MAEAGPVERGPLFRIVRDQRVAFVIVGGFNTMLGTALFVLFQLVFERLEVGRFDYVLSLVCAHAGSVMCSFGMQRTLVFRVRGHFWRDFVRFTGVSMGALGLNLVLLTILVEGAHLPKIPAQLIVTLVIAVGTYFLHRDFSFRRGDRRSRKPDTTDPEKPERAGATVLNVEARIDGPTQRRVQ
ncbi:Putative flippase GtrA (transmembrane translocase of bactoprenol-linked glucose) [Sanguibacter gelidistatuariae]|uniref:Putative flippase GtrA (Transmembrane translocase of bactoprenol-linked glucose) n=1 Tax=Sanguibacter gelidistatuariae TaxID=1814289 RepID=A0A1G6XX67_9MICO|nr:GtrA family protein [Sanguibacter gelidistatuariae]SDD81976.1 Putative flippase GtrA (transmembrane translocase of bactoprenol-linked glucose) [Sanguibacter gelidistatuariae]